MNAYINNRNKSFFALFGIWQNITYKNRVKLLGLIIIIIVSAFFDFLILGSLLSFLELLINPDKFWANDFVQQIAIFFNIEQSSDFLIPTTFLFIIIVLVCMVFRTFNIWLNVSTSASIGSEISCKVFSKVINQPYSTHLKRNSNIVITAISSQVSTLVGVLNSTLQMITSFTLALFITVGLFLISWVASSISIIIFTTCYILLANFTNKKISSLGRQVEAATKNQIKIVQEGLGSIRDLILSSSQKTFIDEFTSADKEMKFKGAQGRFITLAPRYIFEAIGLTVIALITLIITQLANDSDNVSMLPIIGAVAVGLNRLLPTMQQVYSSWSLIEFGTNAIFDLLEIIDESNYSNSLLPIKKRFFLKEKIELSNINFRYSEKNKLVIKGINLTIKKGERIGIIGKTGSGKSTLLDIVLGLIRPSEGKFLIDGFELHSNKNSHKLKEWMSSIAHVPQNIYLTDRSIAENIAIGVPKNKINFKDVKDAAKRAQIHEFIVSKKDGYKSLIGEKAIQLSGGQKQRIAIARALYKKADLIVFDEATSSLDNDTEKAVIDSINKLSKDITIIMVAHRLSTVKGCDRIVILKNGKKIKEGNSSFVFSELEN